MFDRKGETATRFQLALLRSTSVFYEAMNRGSRERDTKAKKKFKKLNVISVFLLCQDLGRNPQFKFDKEFSHKVAEHVLLDKDTNSTGKSTSGPTIAKYCAEWRKPVIEQVGIRLDPKRLFDESEKATIYEHAQGNCGVCGNHVDHPDAEYDHFPIPHALGGKTVVENGRVVHEKCHPRGKIKVMSEEWDGPSSQR